MPELEDQYSYPESEVVPGTIRLIDIFGDLNVKKNDDIENIILLPQPTSNINDPLRWPKFKKNFHFFLVWVWCFMFAVTANFYGPLFDIFIHELGCTYFQLSISVAICFLFLGVGVLIVQPTALKLGKRFTYLGCTVIGIAGCVVGAMANNIGYLYIFQAFAGFAAAPVDSLIEMTSTDLYFQHERSTAFGLAIFALYAGSYLGPVACGYVADGLGWRWCFWVQVIIYGVIFVFFLFTLEETSFRRDGDAEDEFEEAILKQTSSPKMTQSVSNEFEEINSVDESIPKLTYKERMALIHTRYNDPRSWLCIFYRPFVLLSFPAVMWGGLIYGAQMMWLSLVGNTQSLIYVAEPYNFSVNGVGLTNLGAFGGSIFGMIYGGYFVDWSTIKLTQWNHGILEPEFRLYSMVVPTIINAAGLLAYGLGAAYGLHWTISVVIGQGFLGFAMGASGSICLTYAVDSYYKLASECIVLILFIRNMIGMAFCFVLIPWHDGVGLKTTTWMMFGLSIIINGSFITLIKWGKNLRRWTTARYSKYSDPTFGELFRKDY